MSHFLADKLIPTSTVSGPPPPTNQIIMPDFTDPNTQVLQIDDNDDDDDLLLQVLTNIENTNPPENN